MVVAEVTICIVSADSGSLMSESNNLANEEIGDIEELLSRLRDGEEDAATALYLRYARRLQTLAEKQTDQKMAVRVDPEGVVQSVFRTFFRRVNLGQYNVSDADELWKLLLVIALNKLRTEATAHRTAKRDVSKTVSLNDSNLRQSTQDNEALLVLKMTVAEVVGKLSDVEREVVWFRIQGYEIQEIADRCKRSKRSVERILQKFRKQLGSQIQG